MLEARNWTGSREAKVPPKKIDLVFREGAIVNPQRAKYEKLEIAETQPFMLKCVRYFEVRARRTGTKSLTLRRQSSYMAAPLKRDAPGFTCAVESPFARVESHNVG